LHGAERLLRGDRLYIDFFEFIPPGGFIIMAAWFGITGISISSARLLAILTITGIACFTYLACRQASKHEFSSALVAIGWAVMSRYTTPSQYQEACISAMRRASWLVIDRTWTDPNFLRAIYPAIQNAEPRERKRFELALQSGFEFVARDGAFELRRRVKTVDETVCAGIAE
jgi:hypothetical protein